MTLSKNRNLTQFANAFFLSSVAVLALSADQFIAVFLGTVITASIVATDCVAASFRAVHFAFANVTRGSTR